MVACIRLTNLRISILNISFNDNYFQFWIYILSNPIHAYIIAVIDLCYVFSHLDGLP